MARGHADIGEEIQAGIKQDESGEWSAFEGVLMPVPDIRAGMSIHGRFRYA